MTAEGKVSSLHFVSLIIHILPSHEHKTDIELWRGYEQYGVTKMGCACRGGKGRVRDCGGRWGWGGRVCA